MRVGPGGYDCAELAWAVTGLGPLGRWCVVMLWRWVALPVALLSIGGVLIAAMAHGPAHWIAENKLYIDRLGCHCCGETDCMPVDPSLLTETDDGISYGGEKLLKREPGIYWSAEPNPPGGVQRTWVCRNNARTKCILRPQPGS